MGIIHGIEEPEASCIPIQSLILSLDWDVKGVQEETVHKLAGQNKLKDK